MTESFLRYEGIQATAKLAASNNAKVVVVGSGKDGLPIILNTQDTPRLPEMPRMSRMPATLHTLRPKAMLPPSRMAVSHRPAPPVARKFPEPGMNWSLQDSGFMDFLEHLDKTLLKPGGCSEIGIIPENETRGG